MRRGGQRGVWQVDAPEVANQALAVPGATIGQALAIGFLQSKVLAGGAVGGVDGAYAEVHGAGIQVCHPNCDPERSLVQWNRIDLDPKRASPLQFGFQPLGH